MKKLTISLIALLVTIFLWTAHTEASGTANFAQLLNKMTGDGATRLAQLFNNMKGASPKNFAELLNNMNPDDVEQFAAFLSQASEEDIKQLAERLNTTALNDLKGKWWMVSVQKERPSAKMNLDKAISGNKLEQESNLLYIRVKEVESRTEPDVTSEKLGMLKFGDKVQVLGRKDSWLKVSHSSVKGHGWVHSLVATTSKEEIESLQSRDKIPGLLLLMDSGGGGKTLGATLAGGLTIPEEKFKQGKYEPELSPNDCLILMERAIAKTSNPFKFMNYSIQDPLPGKIYCLNKSNHFELLDVLLTHQLNATTTNGSIMSKRVTIQEPFAIKNDKFIDRSAGDIPAYAAIVEVKADGSITIGKPPGRDSWVMGFHAGRQVLWGNGSEHTWIGKNKIYGYTFDSEKDDPLQFIVDKDKGYVYVKGKGTVTMPDGKVVKLPMSAEVSTNTATDISVGDKLKTIPGKNWEEVDSSIGYQFQIVPVKDEKIIISGKGNDKKEIAFKCTLLVKAEGEISYKFTTSFSANTSYGARNTYTLSHRTNKWPQNIVNQVVTIEEGPYEGYSGEGDIYFYLTDSNNKRISNTIKMKLVFVK